LDLYKNANTRPRTSTEPTTTIAMQMATQAPVVKPWLESAFAIALEVACSQTAMALKKEAAGSF